MVPGFFYFLSSYSYSQKNLHTFLYNDGIFTKENLEKVVFYPISLD